jgi:hypothetical protein
LLCFWKGTSTYECELFTDIQRMCA